MDPDRPAADVDDEEPGSMDELMIEAYRRHPQTDGRDDWGDLNAWSDANQRSNGAALDAEDGGW